MITLRHSIYLQCNLAHEQTTLSPTTCSQKISDLFLYFLRSFVLSKNGILQITCRVYLGAVNLESLGLIVTLSNTEASKLCIFSKHGLVVHKFNILLS